MCLAVVALDAHPRYALVVAANRDEYHARARGTGRLVEDVAQRGACSPDATSRPAARWLGRHAPRLLGVCHQRARTWPARCQRTIARALVPADSCATVARSRWRLSTSSGMPRALQRIQSTWRQHAHSRPGVRTASPACTRFLPACTEYRMPVSTLNGPSWSARKPACRAWAADGSDDILVAVRSARRSRRRPPDAMLPSTGVVASITNGCCHRRSSSARVMARAARPCWTIVRDGRRASGRARVRRGWRAGGKRSCTVSRSTKRAVHDLVQDPGLLESLAGRGESVARIERHRAASAH